MFTLKNSKKDFFFDRAKVIAMMDKKTQAALSRAGAYIRRIARSSMRRRKKSSPPGSPPSAHTDPGLKKIIFAYEPERKTVVVGPVGFSGHHVIGGGVKPGVVPQTMEFGGTIGIREREAAPGKWLPVSRRTYPGEARRVRNVKYAARPFMAPALAKETAKGGANRWSASVRSE